MANRWSVKKLVDRPAHEGQWGVYDRDLLYALCDTLVEAHTYATQQAVADVLFNPGGLTRLRKLKDSALVVKIMQLDPGPGDVFVPLPAGETPIFLNYQP